MHILIKNKKLTINDYRIKCAVGKRGIGKKKKEGDFITPIGVFKIKFLLYRKDRVKKINTSLKKYIITKNMGWCDDPNSKKYNRLITTPFNYSHEKLFKKENTYDIILVLNYNMNPIKKNKGSAIFIHVVKRNYKSTLGCIAIKKKQLLKIVKIVRKNSTVKII
jgi:L,D-peptidoglycan transpeptidase YkuD (ErfK/YbiS/YcfS/YnhG family)